MFERKRRSVFLNFLVRDRNMSLQTVIKSDKM